MLQISSWERCFSTKPYFFIFRMNFAFLSSLLEELVYSYYNYFTRVFRVESLIDSIVDFLDLSLTRQDFLISLSKSFRLILRFQGLGQKEDCGSSILYILQMSLGSSLVYSVLNRYSFSVLLSLGVENWFVYSSYMRMFSLRLEAVLELICVFESYDLAGSIGGFVVFGFILVVFGFQWFFSIDLLWQKCRF